MSVGTGEIFDGHATHEEIFEDTVFDDFDALGGNAFVVVAVEAGEIDAGESAEGGIVGDGEEVGENFFVDLFGEGLAFFATALTGMLPDSAPQIPLKTLGVSPVASMWFKTVSGVPTISTPRTSSSGRPSG